MSAFSTFQKAVRRGAARKRTAALRRSVGEKTPGKIGDFFDTAAKRSGHFIGQHPVESAVGGAFAGITAFDWLMDKGEDLADQFGFGNFDRNLGINSQAVRAALSAQARQQRVMGMAQSNMQRLMRVAPHLAAELLAGQHLPQDAVVLGGRPRPDLLERVAFGMTDG